MKKPFYWLFTVKNSILQNAACDFEDFAGKSILRLGHFQNLTSPHAGPLFPIIGITTFWIRRGWSPSIPDKFRAQFCATQRLVLSVPDQTDRTWHGCLHLGLVAFQIMLVNTFNSSKVWASPGQLF